jgi:hypothetical protein
MNLVAVAASTLTKILIGIAVLAAQQMDINATQHVLRPPYNGQENSVLARPFVHKGNYAEQWAATLASDGLQYVITRRWDHQLQSALWLTRAGAHANAAAQIDAQMRQFDAVAASKPP